MEDAVVLASGCEVVMSCDFRCVGSKPAKNGSVTWVYDLLYPSGDDLQFVLSSLCSEYFGDEGRGVVAGSFYTAVGLLRIREFYEGDVLPFSKVYLTAECLSVRKSVSTGELYAVFRYFSGKDMGTANHIVGCFKNTSNAVREHLKDVLRGALVSVVGRFEPPEVIGEFANAPEFVAHDFGLRKDIPVIYLERLFLIDPIAGVLVSLVVGGDRA